MNRATANNDHTVVSLACAGGHLAVVELLLAHGADPTHRLKVFTCSSCVSERTTWLIYKIVNLSHRVLSYMRLLQQGAKLIFWLLFPKSPFRMAQQCSLKLPREDTQMLFLTCWITQTMFCRFLQQTCPSSHLHLRISLR